MDKARVLGDNVRLLLAQKEEEKAAFAEKLGYSLLDVEKLCDARLYTTEEDVKDIADYFSVEPGFLYVRRDESEYSGCGSYILQDKNYNYESRQTLL